MTAAPRRRGSTSASAASGHDTAAAEVPRPSLPPFSFAIIAFLCTLAGAISQRLARRAA